MKGINESVSLKRGVLAVWLSVFVLLNASCAPTILLAQNESAELRTVSPTNQAQVFEPIPTEPAPPLSSETVYVIDLNMLSRPPTSALTAVDPASGQVRASTEARYAPSAALSRDGRSLYILDSYWTRVLRGELVHALTAIDTQTQAIIWETGLKGDRELYAHAPYQQEVWVSSDGQWVYALLSPSRIVKVNTANGAVEGEMSIGASCLRFGKVWLADTNRLISVCDARVAAFDVQFGRSTDLQTINALSLPVVPNNNGRGDARLLTTFVTDGAIASDSDGLHLMLREATSQGNNWSVVAFDLAGAGSARTIPLQLPSGWSPRVERKMAASPDGKRLYVGMARRGPRESESGDAEQIWVFDTVTGQRTGVIPLSDPSFHFALSSDGAQLYSVSRVNQSLAVIDTARLAEVKIIPDVGQAPAWLVTR
ncbi:MAG: hypothetical protein KatS3mg053_3753 [Candidatus Roseilinea sp.]|nr:MAG: hypothetical protein KatS3mg053_3753 [Candidatus Roseilinea sp.]